ncbi:MAG: DUF1579 family protein [Armatimonadetes bacterium]|nr:DUF1579 family protein [Armatimonadota bacterium]
MTFRMFAAVVASVAATVPAIGQELKPLKEIENLSWMVGTWSGSGEISFGGNKVTIKTTMVVSMDGQFLKATATDESSGFKMTKMTMTEWNAAKKQYISYTFTNIGSTARVAHGTFADKSLSMISDPWEAEGMTAVMRETVTKLDTTKCGYSLELKQDNKWAKVMDFVLDRVKA